MGHSKIIWANRQKGSDKGIPGIKVFVDDNSGKAKRVIIQVKSRNVKSGDKVFEMLRAFRSFIGENQMMAYLVITAVRLHAEPFQSITGWELSIRSGEDL